LNDLLKFVWNHPIAAVSAAIGLVWVVVVQILDGYHLIEFSKTMPPQLWTAVGAIIFFISIIITISRFEQSILGKIPSASPAPQAVAIPAVPITRTSTLAAAIPAAAPPDPPSVEFKPLLDYSPSDLVKMIEGKMRVEQDRLIAPYIGEKLKVDGNITDIRVNDSFGTIYLETEKPTVILYFRGHLISRLHTLKKGQRITVIGILDKVHSYAVELENCQFA
jgi:hypothetical protein